MKHVTTTLFFLSACLGLDFILLVPLLLYDLVLEEKPLVKILKAVFILIGFILSFFRVSIGLNLALFFLQLLLELLLGAISLV